MSKMKRIKKITLAAILAATTINPINVFAATSEEISDYASVQEEIIESVESQDNEANVKDNDGAVESENEFDARSAIENLNSQINDLRHQIEEQKDNQERILGLIERLENLARERENLIQGENYTPAVDLNGRLVNPGESQAVTYTQDAVNSQGNSTAIFRYAPNQLYKIYCRVGYLTDLALKKGEKITFVGGGDTSAWAVNSSTVDGVPHIYIKPTVETSTTNLIINTNKRSYQLILNTSEWYNPMVIWSYDKEEQAEALAEQEKEERLINGTMNTDYESLHFNYDVSGDSDYVPVTVFDDGEKTIIKFSKRPNRIPALFIKEKGKAGISLANYTTKNNCYILDRVVTEINLRFSDDEVVKIKRKN